MIYQMKSNPPDFRPIQVLVMNMGYTDHEKVSRCTINSPYERIRLDMGNWYQGTNTYIISLSLSLSVCLLT
jgi:hypothetical protein